MKYAALLLAVFASANAFSINQDNVEEKLRLLNPTFMMLEQLLNLQDESQCIERMFCLIETEMANEVNNPLKHYSGFLTNLYQDIEPMAFEKVKGLLAKYPHISKLIDAISVGQIDGNSETCNKLFESCKNDQSELTFVVKMVGDEAITQYFQNPPIRSKRDPICMGSGVTCSLVGGGCAICNVAVGGSCGMMCGTNPNTTSICTGAGIGCAIG